MEPSGGRRIYWAIYCVIYLACVVWFSYRQRLLQVWQTEELAPTLSNILGASVWVALTSVIILEGVVVMVLFAPAIIEKWKEKGRVEGREQARREYQAMLESAQARIAALEAQVRASNNGESDKG